MQLVEPPSRRVVRWLGLIGAIIPFAFTAAGAQETGYDRAGVSSSPAAPRSALLVTFSSAVLPGAGQVMLGQRRAVAYLALEAAGLVLYVSRSRDGRRQRDLYREISREVARAPFNAAGPQGEWEYYERMEKFVESGAFDVVTGGPVDPETDETTYNGSVWLLARQTYWRDPAAPPDPTSAEYASALRFYGERAVSADMRWSWTGKAKPYQQFRSAIAGSNSAFRSAGQAASLLLANHFLSAVDAYVSVRLRLRRNGDGSVGVTGSMPIGY